MTTSYYRKMRAVERLSCFTPHLQKIMIFILLLAYVGTTRALQISDTRKRTVEKLRDFVTI